MPKFSPTINILLCGVFFIIILFLFLLEFIVEDSPQTQQLLFSGDVHNNPESYALNNIIHVYPDTTYKIYGWHIMGLEGTGHHLWKPIRKSLYSYSKHHQLKTKIISNLSGFGVDCADHWIKKTQSDINLTSSFIRNVMHFSNLENNTLLYLPSLSYPYPRGSWNNIVSHNPNVLSLINMFEKQKQKPLIVKIIYVRRQIIDIFASVCRRVFEGKFRNDGADNKACIARINMFKFVLSEMHKVLSSIDKRYWIMIDYDDIIERPKQYANIVSKFLNIQINDKENKHLIRDLFGAIIKTPQKKESELMKTQNKWNELKKYLNCSEKAFLSIKAWINENYFNYEYWPIFNYKNEKYLTTPETPFFFD